MAAATVASQEYSVFGNKRVSIYNLTSLADTNTLATGFSKIDIAIPVAETGIAVGCTISGGTITFAVASTTPNTRVLVIGM
jgi:hypothetical protein